MSSKFSNRNKYIYLTLIFLSILFSFLFLYLPFRSNDFKVFETYFFNEHTSPDSAVCTAAQSMSCHKHLSAGDDIYLPQHAPCSIVTLGGTKDVSEIVR